MTNRRVRWAVLGVLLALLLILGVWILLREVPQLLRKAEETIAEESARLGLKVSFRNLRFQPMGLRVSLDNLVVEDAEAGLPLLRAEQADLTISPGRILSGYSPVSRVRLRRFALHFQEGNRPLLERIRVPRDGKGEGDPIPEVLLQDGTLTAGPIGPLVRWKTEVPQFRIRDVRFLGTQASGSFARSAATVRLPGAGEGSVPFDTANVDLLFRDGVVRVRNFRATGASASLLVSGMVDTRGGSADLKTSGRADIAGWIRGGAPGAARLSAVATKGNVEFSAAWKGSPEAPGGSVNLLLRDARLFGDTPIEGELSATLTGDRLRIGTLRGTIWKGTFEGSGEADWKSGKGEGRLSLTRVGFGSAPWREWGIPYKPSGSGSAEIRASGDREKVRCSVSVSNPGGLERADDRTGRIPLPIEASLSAVIAPGREIAVESFRGMAGKAELSGKGVYRLADKTIAFSGRFGAPAGTVSQYGWSYPIAWGRVQGGWEVTGTAARMRTAGEFTVRDLAARSLPPVPVSAKFEGDPAKTIHFVADIPAEVAKVTVTGTVAVPVSPAPFLLDASMIVREIDFSRAERWVPAFLASLGEDPRGMERHLAGISGRGSADFQLSVGGGDLSLSGSLEADEVRRRAVATRTLSVSGGWSRKGGADSWKVRASGEIEDGVFLATGGGGNRGAELSVRMETLDLGWVLSLLDRDAGERIGGKAGITVLARTGNRGWEIDRLSVSVPRLDYREPGPVGSPGGGGLRTSWDNVTAEGSLGERTGDFRISSGTPSMSLRGDFRREPDWPLSVSFAADRVPTGFFLDLAGRKEIVSGGTWKAEGAGTVLAGALFGRKGAWTDAVTELAFAVSALSPSASNVSFAELRASVKKEGDSLKGEIGTHTPDSRIGGTLSLREPFLFRVEGPFSIGGSGGAAPALRNGAGEPGERADFKMEGNVEAAGSLRRLAGTTGSLAVRRLGYRVGGIDLAGEEISLRLTPEGIRWGGGSLKASGNPVQVSGIAAWDGALDFRLEGRIPAAAARLATDIFERLDGTVRVNLRVTGRVDDPILVGTGRLEGGTLSFREYAQLFEEVHADLVLSRERILIEDFEGRSGGGYLDGRGEIPLRYDGKQRLFFSVDFFDMRYPYPEELHPVLQGHMELFGPPDDLVVAGEVEVQSARYTKSIQLEKALLDFRRRLADVTARRKESDFRIRLDVDGVADGTIRVKNNLADAVAKGEFKVVGDTRRVIILGSFDGVEGTVDYRGNRYQVTLLNVDFQDPLRNNPRIDARAETKKGNVTVTVSVTGTLEKYEVEFASDPPLSKNDIISLLSLGVTAENLVGAEGSVSAAEAASIALGPYKGRVEEEIRGIVGLDRFSIEPAFSSTDKSFEPRFTVGKSFGDRLSVSVSTAVGGTAESSATAELKVLENVFFQGVWKSATSESEGDLGGDVRFRYRYRQFRDIFHDRD